MIFQIIWFVLWGVLWAVYLTLDGFDFGAGMLLGSIGKTDEEKRAVLKTIGPFWDGNEVWLITAGGATFAAFPTTYALMFSYLYSAMLLLLFSLIIRGVAMEFRGKAEGTRWKAGWDWAVFAGSLLPPLLLGVAFGNIFRGLPMDEAGYHGSLLALLNPYGLLTGVLFVLLCLEHGALWLSVKTDDHLSQRASNIAGKVWYVLLGVAVAFLIYTAFETQLYDNFLESPGWFAIPIIAVLSLAGIKVLHWGGRRLAAFYASSLTILTVTLTGVTGLYPNLIPSNMNADYSLTIFNSSSSVYTLKIMTVVAFLFVPVVIAYQLWMFRTFRKKVSMEEIMQEDESY